MIYINGEEVTYYESSTGALITGKIVNNDMLRLKQITGECIAFSNFDDDGNFSIQLNANDGDYNIDFIYDTTTTEDSDTLNIYVENTSGKYLYIEEDGATVYTFNVNAIQSNYELKVITNSTDTITVENAGNWCYAKYEDDAVKLSIRTNPTIKERNTTVTVKCGDLTAYIYVLQEQNAFGVPSQFELATENVEVEYNTTSFNVGVTEENIKNESITKSDETWFSYNWNYDTDTIEISFETNVTPFTRGGTIQVTAVGWDNKQYSKTIYITQKANETDSEIILDSEEYYIGFEKGSKTTVHYSLKNVYKDSVVIQFSPDYMKNWLKYEIDHNSNNIYFETLETNNSQPEGIQFSITLVGQSTTSPTQVANVFTMNQKPSPDFITFPIWKDTVVEYPSTDEYVDYSIIIDDDVVYNGYAYSINGIVKIKVNEILKNYLSQELNLLSNARWQDNGGMLTARLVINGEDYLNLYTYNDWSYQNYTDAFVSDYISTDLDYRQYFVYSVMHRNSDVEQPRIEVQTDVSNGDDNFYIVKNQLCTETIRDLHNITNIEITNLNTLKTIYFKVGCTSNKYCLYYKNLYGGYCSVLMNQTSKESIQMKSSVYGTNALNTELKHFEKQYERTVAKSWTLNSNLLTDEQSEKFRHIISSNEAYLHNLETNEVTPVNIKDASLTVSTFRNNQRKPNRYTITVEEALNKIVR